MASERRYAEIVTTWASAPRNENVSGGSQSLSMKASSHAARSRISGPGARHSGGRSSRGAAGGRRPSGPGRPARGVPLSRPPRSPLVHEPMKQLADGALADLANVGVPEHQRSVKDLVAERFSLLDEEPSPGPRRPRRGSPDRSGTEREIRPRDRYV